MTLYEKVILGQTIKLTAENYAFDENRVPPDYSLGGGGDISHTAYGAKSLYFLIRRGSCFSGAIMPLFFFADTDSVTATSSGWTNDSVNFAYIPQTEAFAYTEHFGPGPFSDTYFPGTLGLRKFYGTFGYTAPT